MSVGDSKFDVVTVTLNPAIDRTVTISNFTAGSVNRVEAERSNPGGKGVNVACALAEYGHRVAATGFLGRENAAPFEAHFAQKGIADHLIRIAGQTRVGIKISDPKLNQTTDINFPGPTPSARNVEDLQTWLSVLDASWVVLGGSVPPGLDAAIYRDLIRSLKGQGIRVALDASGPPLHLGLEAKPHLFKPNIFELGELLGRELVGESAVIEAARQLIASGIEMVVVSMGKDGACFVTAEEVAIASPPDVPVQSTVGAGDAMVAGIVSAQIQGLPLAECARLSTAFSVHALTRTPDIENFSAAVEMILPQVQTRTFKP